MTPEEWSKAKALFEAALAREPSQREAFLTQDCPDEALRREVEKLLVNFQEAGSFLNNPVWHPHLAIPHAIPGVSAEGGSPCLRAGSGPRVGERLGPYEILTLIGAGGMGEVYRARDTRLKRDVALKVLPEAFARDPERMARFQREAEMLASLNHPNIAQIYGVENRALVMELVEGKSPKGPMPFDEAWHIASQIAVALEYAHDKGIVHRDLKPDNVKVTPEGVVKLLDFGLAKAFAGRGEAAGHPDNSPTRSLGATEERVILGTAAYMSPEQAKGKAVDKRADIWSFGVVLYEMLIGEQLFRGDDISDTLTNVLMKQPDLDKIPQRARRLLRECLEKDPKQRLRDIGDAKRQLVEDAAPAPSHSRKGLITTLAAFALVLGLASGTLAFMRFREKPPVGEVVRFQILAPEKTDFGSVRPALSPDGRKLAFQVNANGQSQIWVRSLDTLEARPLALAGDATGYMIWSPDSRSIAYATTAVVPQLKKVGIAGGPAQTLCEINTVPLGAWSREGVIVFRTSTGLMRVSEAGGACTPLTTIDTKRGQQRDTAPSFLPDGKHFLHLRVFSNAEDSGVYIGSLDAKPDEQSPQRLLVGTSPAVYTPSANGSAGYLLFLREGALMARPFDPRRLAFTGDAQPIAEQVGNSSVGDSPFFSVSDTGSLAYRTAGAARTNQLTWYDRAGNLIGTVTETGDYNTPSLSPDGTRVAFQRRDVQGNNVDIWVQELATGRRTRFTTAPGRDWMPVWSADSRNIVFGSQRDGGTDNLYQKPTSGVAAEIALLKTAESKYPQDLSRDGRFLLYANVDSKSSYDLWVLPLEGERKPKLVVGTQSRESTAKFSPDGRFIAYTSDATGRNEVYVRAFSPDGNVTAEWPVSKDGGTQPVWRQDGKELFFISGDSKMMAVPVTTIPAFKAGIPEALFTAPIFGGGSAFNIHRWDTLDGKRFLISSIAVAPSSSLITLVLNWQAGLRR